MWNPLTSFPWISINLTQSTMKLTMLICWTVLLTTFLLRFGERFSTNNGYSNCYLLCPPCSWPVFIFVWGATEIQYFNCEFPFRMYQNPSILSICIKADIQYKVYGFFLSFSQIYDQRSVLLVIKLFNPLTWLGLFTRFWLGNMTAPNIGAEEQLILL